jgi:hypothetical protein
MSRKRPWNKPDPIDKTLCCVLRSLTGMRISVELQNESEIRGKLETIDAQMKYWSSFRGVMKCVIIIVIV